MNCPRCDAAPAREYLENDERGFPSGPVLPGQWVCESFGGGALGFIERHGCLRRQKIALVSLVELHANQCGEWSARMGTAGNAEEAAAYKRDEVTARELLAKVSAKKPGHI